MSILDILNAIIAEAHLAPKLTPQECRWGVSRPTERTEAAKNASSDLATAMSLTFRFDEADVFNHLARMEDIFAGNKRKLASIERVRARLLADAA